MLHLQTTAPNKRRTIGKGSLVAALLSFTCGCSGDASSFSSPTSNAAQGVGAPVSARVEDPTTANPLLKLAPGAAIQGALCVSVSNAGVTADPLKYTAYQNFPIISGDGNWVVYESEANNLVPNDTNGYDVFIRDLQLDITERIVASSDRTGGHASEQADAPLIRPTISHLGDYVCFESAATNLIDDDTNGRTDIFVWERASKKIKRVSVKNDGSEVLGADSISGGISGNGKRIVFSSGGSLDPNYPNPGGLFVRDLDAGTTEMVSVNSAGEVLHNHFEHPVISADGGHVAFWSNTDNGVPGDTPNEYHADAYVRHLKNSTTAYPGGTKPYSAAETSRVSVNDAQQRGNQESAHPSISKDGRFVAFVSKATNLVPNTAASGRFNVFWHDTYYHTTRCCSQTSGHVPAQQGDSQFPKISQDGKWVAFTSAANDLNGWAQNFQVYLCGIESGQPETVIASVNSANLAGDAESRCGALSADGSRFSFMSNSSNLVDGQSISGTQAYVRDNPAPKKVAAPVKATTIRIGPNGDGIDRFSSCSEDGNLVAFVLGSSSILVKSINQGTIPFTVPSAPSVFLRHPQISPKGRYLAYGVTRFPVDTIALKELGSPNPAVEFPANFNQMQMDAAFSDDEKFFAYQYYQGGRKYVAVRDLTAGTTQTASVDSTNTPVNGFVSMVSISADGRYTSFESNVNGIVPGDADNRSDLFIYDRLNTTPGQYVQRVALPGTAWTGATAVSSDMKWLAYSCFDLPSSVFPGDTNGKYDVFLQDLVNPLNRPIRASGKTATIQSTNSSGQAKMRLSSDGRFVAFESFADGLVSGDSNGQKDVFVYDRVDKALQRCSQASEGKPRPVDPQYSGYVFLSKDARFVTFASLVKDLVDGDNDAVEDIFRRTVLRTTP